MEAVFILNKTSVEVTAIVGIVILGSIALIKSQPEIAAGAVGGIAGYLGHKITSNESSE